MTPGEQMMGAAAQTREVRDALGRRLTVKRLNALDRLRLFKAVGPVLAENAAYLGMGMLALSVIALDDVPQPMPVSEAQLEALIGRLGDAGLEAAASVFPDEAGLSEQGIVLAGN